jgi:WD40 repeat protein/energy-coupling factor transporter ATP-binding protein EcfA2
MTSGFQLDESFSPFPGLRSFTPEESEYFFGRDRESEEIFLKLLRNRFVAITGASGSGKSSIVLSGLIPRIKSLSDSGNAKWRTITVRPGSDPVRNLAAALAGNGFSGDPESEPAKEILRLLKEEPDGIGDAIRNARARFSGKTLLFIDQFEELFREGSFKSLPDRDREVTRFINLLTNSVSHNNPDIYLVVAIRSDLITECSQYRGFTNLINGSSYMVSRMNNESLREAIVGPVKTIGAEIDPDLVELLVSEVSGPDYQLPILQHALMRTWLRWKELDEPDRPIDFSDYFAIGTIRDSISRHADELYEKLDARGKLICERLFKNITGPGPDNKGIRLPLSIKDLKSAIQCGYDELIQVVEEFRNPAISVLTPHYSVPLDDNSVVDLSHESIILLWTRLRQWVAGESASVQMYLRLSETSALYQQGKAGLLKQPELQLALNWREQNKPTLSWAVKHDPAFERAMVFLRTSEKESLEAEERKARHNRWRLKRIRIISSIFGGLAILAGLITLIALGSKLSADKKRRTVEKQKVEVEAQKSLAEEYACAALVQSLLSDSAAAAARMEQDTERMLRLKAENDIASGRRQIESIAREGSLARMMADSAFRLKDETQRLRMVSLAKSMSLRSLQLPAEDELQPLLAYQAYLFNSGNKGSRNDADIYAGLYNVAKNKGSTRIKNFTGMDSHVKSIAFIPGKNEFFSSDSGGNILRWDMASEDQSFRVVYSGDEVVDVMAVSPESEWLAFGAADNKIGVLPVEGNDKGFELNGHTGKIRSLVFSYDGNYLYSAALDGKVLKWDLTARTSTDIGTGAMQVTSIALSINNNYIAGISDQGLGLVWNPGQNGRNLIIGSDGRKIRNIRFKPDDDRIAVGYDDGTIELWDIAAGERITGFKAHQGGINDIRFNGNNSQMATAATDGTLKLWDTGDLTAAPVTFTDNEGVVVAFDFSPDGGVILSAVASEKPKMIARPAFADTFAADGCTYVTRNFTPEEWLAYVGKDIAYEETCEGADLRIRIKQIR